MADLRNIAQNTSQVYTALVKDENDAVIALSRIDSIVLTLYNVHTNAIINNRDSQNVLNANNVTVHATSGLLTWDMQPADNVIIIDALKFETHRALFEWTYDTNKTGKHEVELIVRNLSMVD